MRTQKIYLQFANLLTGNAHVAELAHAGRDRVRQSIAGDDIVDDGSRLVHSFARIGRQQHRPTLDRYLAHRFQSEVVTADVKSVQEGFPFCFPTAARNAVKYFSGKTAIFISASVTMWVVSPSASSTSSAARRSL